MASKEVSDRTALAHDLWCTDIPLPETVFLQGTTCSFGSMENTYVRTIGIGHFTFHIRQPVDGRPFHVGLAATQPNLAQ